MKKIALITLILMNSLSLAVANDNGVPFGDAIESLTQHRNNLKAMEQRFDPAYVEVSNKGEYIVDIPRVILKNAIDSAKIIAGYHAVAGIGGVFLGLAFSKGNPVYANVSNFKRVWMITSGYFKKFLFNKYVMSATFGIYIAHTAYATRGELDQLRFPNRAAFDGAAKHLATKIASLNNATEKMDSFFTATGSDPSLTVSDELLAALKL